MVPVCSHCGVARRYIGVVCPARRLCACETGRTCVECDESATVVEFQSRVDSGEQPLPRKSNSEAVFFCTNHAPFTEEEGDAADARPLPVEKPKPVRAAAPPPPPLVPAATAVSLKGLNIDPEYLKTADTPPFGAISPVKVECVACKDSHAMRERKKWNGTESECPQCGEVVYTYAWEDEDGRHDGRRSRTRARPLGQAKLGGEQG